MEIYNTTTAQAFPENKRVDFPRFQSVIYPVIKGDSKLTAHEIWDQMKLYIKGSADATVQGHDLTREQYCNEKHFPMKKKRMDRAQRDDAYDLYMRYHAYQKTSHLWDDCDMLNGVSMEPSQKRTLSRRGSKGSDSNGSREHGSSRKKHKESNTSLLRESFNIERPTLSNKKNSRSYKHLKGMLGISTPVPPQSPEVASAASPAEVPKSPSPKSVTASHRGSPTSPLTDDESFSKVDQVSSLADLIQYFCNMNIYTEKPMSDPYPEDKRVDYPRFQNVIYPVIKGNSKLGPHAIWDQIKLYIKGSAEAIMQHHDLTKDQYMDEKHFPPRRLKLTREEREDAYAMYQRYHAYQKTDHLWDDCDKANGIVYETQKLHRQLSRHGSMHSTHSISTHTLSRSNSSISRQSSFANSPHAGSEGGLSPLPSLASMPSRYLSRSHSITSQHSHTSEASGSKHRSVSRQPSLCLSNDEDAGVVSKKPSQHDLRRQISHVLEAQHSHSDLHHQDSQHREQQHNNHHHRQQQDSQISRRSSSNISITPPKEEEYIVMMPSAPEQQQTCWLALWSWLK